MLSDLESFYNDLINKGLNIKFVRLPYGLRTEIWYNLRVAGLKSPKLYSICCLVLLWILLGCQSVHSDNVDFYIDSNTELLWINKDTIFVHNSQLDKQWVLDISTKSFSQITYSTLDQAIAFSPKGELIVVSDLENQFRFGPINGPLSNPVNLDIWITLPVNEIEDKDKYIYENLENRLFWLSDDLIFINQRNKDTNQVICKTYNTQTTKWHTINTHCIDNLNLDVVSFLYNPKTNLLVERSQIANTQNLFVNQWRPNTYLKRLPFPVIDLSGGYVYSYFNNYSDDVDLITPCFLERTDKDNLLPCDNIDWNKDSWHHYRWSPKTKLFPKVIKNNLPVRSVPDPNNSHIYAWIKNNKVCIGNPDKQSDFECVGRNTLSLFRPTI